MKPDKAFRAIFYWIIPFLVGFAIVGGVATAGKPIATFDQLGTVGLAGDDDYSLPLGQLVNAGSGIRFFINRDVDTQGEELSEFIGDTPTHLFMVLPTVASNVWLASNDNTATSLVFIQGAAADGSLQSEEITLTGQTPVIAVNSYLRVWTARVIDDNGLLAGGKVYVARNAGFTGGVPNDPNNVLTYFTVGNYNQMQPGFMIPLGNVGLIKRIALNVGDNTGQSNTVLVKVQVRPPGGSWLTRGEMALDRGSHDFLLPEPIKIEPLSDIRFTGASAAANGQVSGSYSIRLIPDTLCDTVGIMF